MADSLLFDGTDDAISLDAGDFLFSPPDAWSFFAVVKRTNATTFDGIAYIGESGVGAKAGMSFRADDLFLSDTNFPGGQGDDQAAGAVSSTLAVTSTTTWYLVGYTKAAGTDLPTFHRWDYSLEAWTHEDGGGAITQNACSGTIDLATIGCWFDSGLGDFFQGNICVVGFWDSNIGNNAAVEALFQPTAIGDAALLQTWVDAAPTELIRCDSLSTLTSLTGTMAETGRTGTTVDTGDVPPGWDDTLSGGAPAYPVVDVSYADFPKPKLAGRVAV